MIKLEAGQYLFMANTTAGIFVDGVDKLLDGALAVADYMTRHSFRGSDELAVHHQQAVIVTLKKTFDDHIAAMLSRLVECGFDFAGSLEIDRHATAVVA